jgi:hypothetical protein
MKWCLISCRDEVPYPRMVELISTYVVLDSFNKYMIFLFCFELDNAKAYRSSSVHCVSQVIHSNWLVHQCYVMLCYVML